MSAAQRLRRLTWALADEPVAGRVAARACEGLRDATQADGAAITAEASALHRVTLWATDERADLLENLQEVVCEGPGMDAFDSGRQIRSCLDRAAAERWPQFVPAAAELLGWDATVWSIPMRFAGEPLGTVTLYRSLPAPSCEPAVDVQFLADLAASGLVRDPSGYRDVTDSACTDCWSSRAVVHQATGMLISQLGVGAEQALRRLRDRSRLTGRRLSEVAADVVERRLDLATGRGAAFKQAG